jgi:hypothetical protein
VTKTPAKTLASSAAPTTDSVSEAGPPKARTKPATKVSSPADGPAAAGTPLKKPSAKADTEPMTAAKSPGKPRPARI